MCNRIYCRTRPSRIKRHKTPPIICGCYISLWSFCVAYSCFVVLYMYVVILCPLTIILPLTVVILCLYGHCGTNLRLVFGCFTVFEVLVKLHLCCVLILLLYVVILPSIVGISHLSWCFVLLCIAVASPCGHSDFYVVVFPLWGHIVSSIIIIYILLLCCHLLNNPLSLYKVV